MPWRSRTRSRWQGPRSSAGWRASTGCGLREIAEVQEIYLPDRSFDVDTVAVALGRQPDPELALQALARNVYSVGAGGFVPRRGDRLETSTAGVYVAGEAAGNVSVAEAMAEGWLAGLAAAGASDDRIGAARDTLSAVRDEARASVVDSLRLEAALR